MYSPAQFAFKYLHYYLTASNSKGHGVHSPFVFEFITRVLNDKTNYGAYRQVEDLRKQLLNNRALLHIDDLGAGSAVSTKNQRTIASIARYAAKSRKFGELLYRMVKYYQPENILELGTSLGITTCYLSLAKQDAKILTIEGAAAIAAVARENFSSLGLENPRIVEGNFDQMLSPVISELPSVDLAFIDGNHRLQPTIQYYETLLPKTQNNSMIILDDIHWSNEMEKAWKYCREHSAVTLSIDLFFIGILIFRKEIREKQHFSIRF